MMMMMMIVKMIIMMIMNMIIIMMMMMLVKLPTSVGSHIASVIQSSSDKVPLIEQQ